MNRKILFIILSLILINHWLIAPIDAHARIIIDIIKSPKPLPIAVQELTGFNGNEISEIIQNDLALTGLFDPIDKDAFIEPPSQPFKQSNWTVLGAEVVVKGSITLEDKIKVTINVYDVFEGKAILIKNYVAGTSLLRPLAHTIANDIYKRITNHDGIFRSKIAFVTVEDGKHRLNIMDWDGKRITPLKITAPILMTPHWSEDNEKLLYSAQWGRRWNINILDLATLREKTLFRADGTNLAGDFIPGKDEFALSSSQFGTPDIYIFNLARARLTRITKDRGIEVSPAVSPDGKTIAFVSDKGGTAQIYTMNKIGYNKSRITFDSNYNTAPSWSPIGDKIAFVGYYKGKNQIFTVGPDGTDSRMLTHEGNNEEPSFSPDGRFIVFTSDRDGKRGIYIMRSDGEGQIRITPFAIKAQTPRWSPK